MREAARNGAGNTVLLKPNQRGTLTESGKESPYRNRTIEENLDLFARMRAGEFPPAEDNGVRYLKIPLNAV